MRTKTKPAMAPSLTRGCRRFKSWRDRNRPRTRLPEELWALAVDLAQEQGLNKTVRALGLDYNALKRKVAGSNKRKASEEASPGFIECFPAVGSVHRPECTVELEDVAGARMRIHLKGTECPDLAALTRAFRRGRE